MASLVVETLLGKVGGSEFVTDRGETIYCFQGIPYAKPPIGQLRFKNPEPAEAWTGIREDKVPAAGPAIFETPDKQVIIDKGSSEDCLYLNIFTPQAPGVVGKSKLPVYVWIHGGGFTCGCGNKDWYGPDYLVPKGVILVSINYRLGPFGFLSFENAECSGNFGLKDQSLALRWIQDNIGAFGGDAGNVTLTGESAGAASVQYHMLSPLSRGLFHRAIAMSGSALNRWAFSRSARKSAFKLAERLGYRGDDATEALNVVKAASTEDVLKSTLGVFKEIEGIWAGEEVMVFPFVPTAEPDIEGAFLTKHPKQALQDGDSADVPYMTGICDSEAIFLLPKPDFEPDWDDDLAFQAMLPKELELQLGSPKLQEAAQKLKQFYFPNGTSQRGWINVVSAFFITYGVYKTIDTYAKSNKKVTPNYLYIFTASRKPSSIKSVFGVNNVEGTSHADDMEFVFNGKHPALGFRENPIPAGSTDEKVMENFTKVLTDFAKTGVPSAEWPAVSDAQQQYPYMQINALSQVKNGFFAREGQFWDEIYASLQAV